jgi:hypothetical protein
MLYHMQLAKISLNRLLGGVDAGRIPMYVQVAFCDIKYSTFTV